MPTCNWAETSPPSRAPGVCPRGQRGRWCCLGLPASAIRRLAGTGKTALRGRLPEVTGNDKNSAAAYWGPFLFHGILSGHHLAANAQAPVPSPGAAQASRVWPDRVGDPGTPPGSLSCVGTLSGLAAFVSVRAFILPPWTLARIGACSLSLAMDGRAALAPRAGSSGLRGPFFLRRRELPSSR